MGLTPGSRLGPYEIAELVGAGGMGEVYRARDTRLDRTVAIKVLSSALSADPARRERFDREARSIAALSHPHICVLHDLGHQDGIDFLVMEHVTGDSLAERLKKGPLPLAQVLQIGIQIADALDRAHRSGIVHRDLKPSNIILTGAGASTHAKLLDFGLAKLMAPAVAAVGSMVTQAPPVGGDLTGEGTVVGTTRYMAPEQVEGGTVDGRTDIFALGAVLYEMTTGQKAFEGKSHVSVVAAILEHEPTPISKLQPLTPPAFEHVVTTCLAKAPDDRWQTAKDVAKQLQWIASTLSSAMVASQPSASVKRRSRMRAALVTLVTIAAIGATWAIATRFKPVEAPPQVMRFEIPTITIANPNFLPMLAASPDGRWVAFVAQDGGTTPTLWLRSVDAVEARKIPGTEGALNPFWSPDSRHLGYGAGGRLMQVDIGGGPPQMITSMSVGTVFTGGTWSANNIIVFSRASGLMRVSASGGEATPVTQLDTSAGDVAHAWPFFLPDGHHVLFLVARGGDTPRKIRVVDINDPKQSVDLLTANSNALYSRSGHLLFHRDGTLLAQAFDPDKLVLSGEPVRVADGLAYSTGIGRVAATVSNTGLLATRAGAAFETTRLVWFDRKGARLETVGEPALYRGVDISPNGQLLAYHVHLEPSGGDVWVRDLRRATATRYTFNGHNFSASWSRDGKYVMFTSDREGGSNLYRKAVGAAAGDEMMMGSGTAAFVEDISPDGEWMVYGGQTRTGLDILRVPLNRKGDPEPVVATPFFDGLSKISPDGRFIAYESEQSGRREVFAQPFPKATTKWQISTDGGRYVRWSVKGDEIYYVKDDGTLMSASARVEGDALVIGNPKALFKADPIFSGHRGSTLDMPYDVTADGQRFIVNERVAPAAQQSPISVVVNWTSLLPR
jgi:eukaryotic-like serine/threonine-protein kinase